MAALLQQDGSLDCSSRDTHSSLISDVCYDPDLTLADQPQLESVQTDEEVPMTLLHVYQANYFYTIPSFSVITVHLKHVKYTVDVEDASQQCTPFDGFMKNEIIHECITTTMLVKKACFVEVCILSIQLG